jgi:hypothetical protein
MGGDGQTDSENQGGSEMKSAMLVLLLFVMVPGAFSQGYMSTYRHPKTMPAIRTATTHTNGDSIFVHGTGLNVTFYLVMDTTLTTVNLWFAVNGDSTNKFPIYGNTSGGEIFATPISMPAVKYLKIWGSAANLPGRLFLY